MHSHTKFQYPRPSDFHFISSLSFVIKVIVTLTFDLVISKHLDDDGLIEISSLAKTHNSMM